MGLIAFLAPSLLVYVYVLTGLKYLVLIFLSSFILFFIVRVLMLYEISFKNAMCCAFYSGTILILLEAIIYPINPLLLVPVFDILGLHFYVVSYVVFLVFGVLGMVLVEKKIGRHRKKPHGGKHHGS